MYAIIDSKPFAVRGDKVYEVSFGDRGTVVIGKEIDVAIEGKLYTYDEISRKFNLKAMLQKKNEPTKELVEELNKQIDALTKENDNLKKQIQNLTSPIAEEQVQEVVEEKVEVKQGKKNK